MEIGKKILKINHFYWNDLLLFLFYLTEKTTWCKENKRILYSVSKSSITNWSSTRSWKRKTNSREGFVINSFVLDFIVKNYLFIKGTFTENFDECTSQSNIDGNYPQPSSSSPTTPITNSNSLANNSALINSQTHLNNPSASLPCTVSKRPQKLNNNDDLLTTSSLVQTTTATTTRNNKISNGNDDDSSSTYKQQKKQLVKSSNTQNTQSRRQQKKQEREQIRATSRDSSSSYNNGFQTNIPIENSDIEKK